MATFGKEDNGLWRARVRLKQQSFSQRGFRTKAAAQAWAAQKEAEILAGARGEVPDKTFGDLLTRYKDVAAAKRGGRWETIKINAFLRDSELVHIKLDRIGPPDFAAWRDRRLKEVSAGTVLREWNILSGACTVALKEWRWLREHPLRAVARPAQPAPRTRVLAASEVEALLHVCGDDYSAATGRVGLALRFALETAMRAGEICGLTWADIGERTAHLPRTKNGSARTVPLSSEAREILSLLPRGDGPVFGLAPASLDALFRKVRRKANLENLHFHDSRRTALTAMAAKVDVLTLAKISGHRDLRILSAVYYAPDMGDVADRLG